MMKSGFFYPTDSSGALTLAKNYDPYGQGDYNSVTLGINLYRSFGQAVTVAQFLQKLGGGYGFDKHAMSPLSVEPYIADQWPYPAGFFDPTKPGN